MSKQTKRTPEKNPATNRGGPLPKVEPPASTRSRASISASPPFRAPQSLLARRYDSGEPVRISLIGGKIVAIEPAWADDAGDWPLVAPGLFDLQVNGYGGVWFADRTITPEKAAAAIAAYIPHGVTRLCPTLITSSHETLKNGFIAIRKACESTPWINHVVAGCHLEGPYLSGEDGPRGAHPRDQIRPADWDEFCTLQKASGNRIRLVTIAPEVPHAIGFITRAVASGVTISIGHTAATGAQIRSAVDAGARLSTHLGNGAHPILRRHPNYIWEQLGEPRLSASLIADGQHLPESVVRSMVWAKSVARTILTCDASGWAGSPPGTYANELGKVDVLENGRIAVAGQNEILAGSGSITEMCVAETVRCGAATLRDAIDMACRNPSRLLGCGEQRLMAGDPADLFVFRHDAGRAAIDVQAVLVSGELHHGNL